MHKQPLLFAGPLKEPRLFLGTLPAPVSSSKEDGRRRVMGAGACSDGQRSDEGLRIAWQYKKYFGDEKASSAEHKGGPSLPVLMFCFILLFSCWLFYAVHIEPPVLFKIS